MKLARREMLKRSLAAWVLPFTKFNLMKEKEFDVIIIGGSYAGLSAAMSLGRSLRRVLIIDSGLPCNRQTPHSHNFITQDGETPAAIAEKARLQVLQYSTVELLQDLAVAGTKSGEGFEITTASGKRFIGRKLIFATGIKDIMPDIKGFAECWGISVVHCPYCHGYEYRGRKTGIMANGDRAFHVASLVNNLTNDITILGSGFSATQLDQLKKHRIRITETEVAEIVHENGHISKVIFKDGTTENFDAVYAAIPFTQHSDIPVALGCVLNDAGYIKIDDFHKTNVEGVFACGDNSSGLRSVANAVGTGSLTGAMVNRELTEERF